VASAAGDSATIENQGTITTIANTIIANSITGGNCQGYAPGANTKNLTDSAGCSTWGWTTTLVPASDLGALASNGGPTKTHALLFTSPTNPAIDTGHASTCSNAPVSGKDQRGIERPQGAKCDIGAYEYVHIAIPQTPSGSITDRTPKYTWTKVFGATNYQIQLKQGVTIIYNKYASSSTCGSSKCSKTPTTTLGYNTYKWRVRAKESGVWKAWSAYKSFTVTPIPVPTPKTPSDDITDTTPKYTWTKEVGAVKYQIQLRQGTTVIYNKFAGSGACGSSTCSKTPSTTLGYLNYKWRVRAKVGGVWGAWSSYKTFTVKPGPKPKTPSGNITDRTPKYTWTVVSGAAKYQIQLRKGTTLVYNKYASSTACGTSTCSKTPATILGYFNYKWRVRAKIGGVWGPWSFYKTFTVNP